MYDIALPIVNASAATLAVAAYMFSAWRIWPEDKFWSVLFGFMALICAGVTIGFLGIVFSDVSPVWAITTLRLLIWPIALFPAVYIAQQNV